MINDIEMDVNKLKAEKELFKTNLLPQWIKKAEERESYWVVDRL